MKPTAKKTTAKRPPAKPEKVATKTIAVFAQAANVADAIINKLGLKEEDVEVILTSESETAYKAVGDFKGQVYCTNLIDARIGAPMTKVPMWPTGLGKRPKTAFGQKIWNDKKKKAWETLRNPKTPVEVIEKALGEPSTILSCELDSYTASTLDMCHDLFTATGGEVLEAWTELCSMFGHDPIALREELTAEENQSTEG